VKTATTVAAAAAAAAAYAAAAIRAARAAQAAAEAVKDAPATKMASLASTMASFGPLGVFADVLGTESSREATSTMAFKDVSEEMEDLLGDHETIPPQFTFPVMPSAMSQAMLAARRAESSEEKKKAVQYSMGHMAQMPIKHDSLKEELAQLSSNLQQRVAYLGRPPLALGSTAVAPCPPCSLRPTKSTPNKISIQPLAHLFFCPFFFFFFLRYWDLNSGPTP
jgi:hypothetical protein